MSDRSTLSVRVEPSEDFHERVERRLNAPDSGDPGAAESTLSLPDDATLSRIFDETTLTLLRSIATNEPSSMRETARLVDRDVKDVSRQLHELDAIGVLMIEEAGRSKRPVVPYDEIALRLAVRGGAGTAEDSAVATDRSQE